MTDDARLLRFPVLPPSPDALAPVEADPVPAPPGQGHRERLKERFRQGQGVGLADYELLELTLGYTIPRRDVKPLAKSLLARFGSLHGVLTASQADLQKTPGLGAHSATFLQLTGALARRIGKEQLSKNPVLANKLALYDYMYSLFADKTREEVHILYLTSQHQLITDDTLYTGTLTQSVASPRDILKKALSHNAAGLIVAHNHPSGVPTPSQADHAFTQTLAAATHNLGLVLHDHLIVGKAQIYSFRASGHLT